MLGALQYSYDLRAATFGRAARKTVRLRSAHSATRILLVSTVLPAASFEQRQILLPKLLRIGPNIPRPWLSHMLFALAANRFFSWILRLYARCKIEVSKLESKRMGQLLRRQSWIGFVSAPRLAPNLFKPKVTN